MDREPTQLELVPGLPLSTFIALDGGYLFLTEEPKEKGARLVENASLDLGLVRTFDVVCSRHSVGYWFLASVDQVRRGPNYLVVYRKRIREYINDLIKDPKLKLRFRPNKLRIFTIENDYVLISSDSEDVMKQSLSRQD